MLSDLRFIFGATLATALLAVTTFGFAVSLRLSQQARVGPLEASRSMAYAAPTDWNQFHDPAGARRFDQLDVEGRLAIERALAGSRQRVQDDVKTEQTASIPAPKATRPEAESTPPQAVPDIPALPDIALHPERLSPSEVTVPPLAAAPPMVMPPQAALPLAAPETPAPATDAVKDAAALVEAPAAEAAIVAPSETVPPEVEAARQAAVNAPSPAAQPERVAALPAAAEEAQSEAAEQPREGEETAAIQPGAPKAKAKAKVKAKAKKKVAAKPKPKPRARAAPKAKTDDFFSWPNS